MSEIPEDLIGKANEIWIEALEEGSPDSALIIARALLAEREAQRERDAKIASDWGSVGWEDHDDSQYRHGYEAACDDIAHEIRKVGV